MLALVGAQKTYVVKGRPPVCALAAVSIEFPEATTTVLIGPSGCGKSTALRALIGLISLDAGRVVFAGRELTPNRLPEIRARTGYVIQEGGLFPHMTARRNITLMPTRRGWDRSRIRSRLDDLVALTRFPADALDRYPGELSGGQRQRISLMRALMPDPDALLLDEPLGALDPMVRAELQDQLKEIFAKLSKTVVMVTHDLDEAAHLADSIVLMRDGAVVQHGTIQELCAQPADPFVTEFVRAQRGHLGEILKGIA